jgi:hypothetical protein
MEIDRAKAYLTAAWRWNLDFANPRKHGSKQIETGSNCPNRLFVRMAIKNVCAIDFEIGPGLANIRSESPQEIRFDPDIGDTGHATQFDWRLGKNDGRQNGKGRILTAGHGNVAPQLGTPVYSKHRHELITLRPW